MSIWSLVYVPEIETGRHVKNNACTVEIKIKWMMQKHMTYENTYRDENCNIYWNTWNSFFLMGLDRRHHRYSSRSDSLQSTHSFTSFIIVINLIFLLGEVNTFFNPKDSSYMYLLPSLLVNFLTNYATS